MLEVQVEIWGGMRGVDLLNRFRKTIDCLNFSVFLILAMCSSFLLMRLSFFYLSFSFPKASGI